MTLETPERKQSKVLLTYVTEAPSWKPSYRIVVGKAGKVMLEGWAIVDNTTSEDWRGVLVGVGASSALAFRYDLWSVRSIDRDLLASEEKFAVAPPTGVSPYSASSGEELGSIDPAELRGGGSELASSVSVGGASGGSSTQNVFTIEGVYDSPGGIQGIVTDKKSGEKLAASRSRLRTPERSRQHHHGRDGASVFRPPTARTSDLLHGDTAFERKLDVSAGKTASVMQRIDQGRGGGGETS